MKRVLLRLGVAFFCWMTAVYAFLCSSAFAYQQFIRPRVFHWIGVFSDLHSVLYFVWLPLALASVHSDFRQRGFVRAAAVSFAAVWSAIGVWLALHPLLPTLSDDGRGIWVGMAAILPLLWLGVSDVAVSIAYLKNPVHDEIAARAETALFAAAVGTAIVVPLLYGFLTAIAIGVGFEPDLLGFGLSLGLVWNAAAYLTLLSCAFLIAALIDRLTLQSTLPVRYTAAGIAAVTALAYAAREWFANAIGLSGAAAVIVSVALALSIAASCFGLRLRAEADRAVPLTSGFDGLFGPASRRPGADAAALAVVAVCAWTLNAAALRLDWDFTIAKLTTVAVCFAVFERLYRLAPRRPIRLTTIATVTALPLVFHVADAPIRRSLERRMGMPGFTVRHALDRYVVYNPAFRLADGLLQDSAEAAPSFDRFLRENTGLPVGASRPAAIDFVRPLAASPSHARPWIFLFVVDSLRPDYLGAYNSRVEFTPKIDQFAREAYVFRRAFTRYGGTGLSVPSIWMGAAGVHTQYVEPFGPMNALEKLLDANGYARYVSMDHIMAQLLTPSPALGELDRGVQEMSLDLCRTLTEVGERVASAQAPIFAHSRSLNLHVAAIRGSAVPAGETYAGFEPRYASRVHRMDSCFGDFIDLLKRQGIYDDSIVVLTADHGEELGADGRWGHAYYLFPGVLEVPLLVHVPRRIAAASAVDLDAAAFTTDLTPTLYAALGYRPGRASPLMGAPLIGSDGGDFSARRRGTEVVIASYGAVYGTLLQNGRRLYIADANHSVEYGYERAADGWRQVPVTDAVRAIGRRAIREYVEEIAREYDVHLG